jgi:hypothetical protein
MTIPTLGPVSGQVLIHRHASEQRDLYARLRWRYGDQRALDIISGTDARAETDQKAWRRLGAKT